MNFVKFLRTPFYVEHLWWLLLLYTLQAAISQSHINFTVSLMTCFYILNMSVDVNTWHAVTGLFVNTTQQFAVFHLCLF